MQNKNSRLNFNVENAKMLKPNVRLTGILFQTSESSVAA